MSIKIKKIDIFLVILGLIFYIFRYFFIGWSLFINLFLLFFLIKLFEKTYQNKQIHTKTLLIIVFFIFINNLIKIGVFLDKFKSYSIIEKNKINQSSLISPTQTIQQCSVINYRTKTDIEKEFAEKNLSSYSYLEEFDSPDLPSRKERKTIKVSFLEKILLPCKNFDEDFCQIKNDDKWTIKYPRNWKLYRIKRQVFDSYTNNSTVYYDLKFEYKDSYFYLEEIHTLGGQPIVINYNKWNYLKKFCQEKFHVEDNEENYLCFGNIKSCASENYLLPLNSYYKSFVRIIPKSDPGVINIDDWYIPSIEFEKNGEIRAKKVYIFSNNFYSNDEKFNSQLKRFVYLFNKKYIYSDDFTKTFIERVEEKPIEWEKAFKLKANKMAEDLVQILVQYSHEEISEYYDFFEYWTNNRTGKWQLLEKFFAGQEGPSTCDYWEKLRVAKGMDCLRKSGIDSLVPDKVKF